MKSYILTFASLLIGILGASVFTSCSEDSYYQVDTDAVPVAAEYADMINVNVDQAANIASFSFEGNGVYPVWIVDGKSYSTSHKWTKYYRKAGDYTVEVKIANGNGVSKEAITKTFHIDKTIMSGFGGYAYDSPYNLWQKDSKADVSFYYAPGWSQIADPGYSFDGETLSLHFPEATSEAWQNQVHMKTNISLQAGEHYDGSIIFTSTKDMNGVTIKLHPDGDDDHAVWFNNKVSMKAGEPVAVWFCDGVADVDYANLLFTFDFGGNPADVDVTIENFVIKKHSDDDGTILPEIPTTPEPQWVDLNSVDNIWNSATIHPSFYYAPGWSQLPDPALTNDAGVWTLPLPQATSETWQAQCLFNTDIAIEDPSIEYDFRVDFESTTDLPKVIVKLVQTDEPDVKHDQNFFFAEEISLVANTEKTFWQAKVKVPEAMPNLSLVLDFGGNPDGTEVKISNIILQKHRE